MDIIQMTRELAKAIALDERVIKYNMAREKGDNDLKLQEKIGTFNLKRMELNGLLGKEDKDEARVAALDKEIRALYDEVMQDPIMAACNETKAQVDALMNFINQILAAGVNGEDPDSVEDRPACSGSCSGCSGCH